MPELLTGLALGLAAGISPGPLQALVVTSTLQRGFGAGWRVAIAPLLTDVPIVLLAAAALAALPGGWLRGIGIAGGVIVIGFGLAEIRTAGSAGLGGPAGPADVWRGVVVNAASPHPWVFWAAVGGPVLVAAWRVQPARGIAFLAGFYGLLVGSKLALAGVVAATRDRLPPRWQRRLVLAGGVLLVAAGVVLIVRSA